MLTLLDVEYLRVVDRKNNSEAVIEMVEKDQARDNAKYPPP